jgi:probable phosphoglycerate mutase
LAPLREITMAAPTTFGLLRHSRTVWNEEKRIQGLQNSPLSATGKKMAEAWGKELQVLPWDAILASDLGRVRETVALINKTLQLPVVSKPLLREQDWGRWSGLSFPELFAQHKEVVRQQEQRGWNFRPPGGESRKEVLARALQSLEQTSRSLPGKQVLVVCHEGIIKALIYHLLERKFMPDEPKIFQGYQLHLLKMQDKQLTLTGLNHLQLTGAEP